MPPVQGFIYLKILPRLRNSSTFLDVRAVAERGRLDACHDLPLLGVVARVVPGCAGAAGDSAECGELVRQAKTVPAGRGRRRGVRAGVPAVARHRAQVPARHAAAQRGARGRRAARAQWQ